MKLSIDWSEGVNARVLTGSINGLDAATNTATVMVNNVIVADVPIHYWCHHGVNTHAASRVFITGDDVAILYTGLGATPDKNNMTIVGLKNQIRRCRNIAGIYAEPKWGGSYYSATTVIGLNMLATNYVGYQNHIGTKKIIYDGTDASITTGTPPSVINWIGPAETLEWQWSSTNRYAGAPVSSSIYQSGSVIAVAPDIVRGAAIFNDFIIVFCTSTIWRKYKRSGTGATSTTTDQYDYNKWYQIGYFGGTTFTTAALFSKDGTKAVLSDGKDLYKFDISESSTGQSIESSSGSICYPFADYKENTLVRAVAAFTSTYSTSSTGGEFIIDTDFTAHMTGSSTRETETTFSLSLGLYNLLLFKITELRIGEVTTAFYGSIYSEWRSRTFEGQEISQMSKSTSEVFITSTLIVDVDLRFDYLATYEVSYHSSNSSGYVCNLSEDIRYFANMSDLLPESYRHVVANKKINDTTLFGKELSSGANGTFDLPENDCFFYPNINTIVDHRSAYSAYFMADDRLPSGYDTVLTLPIPFFSLRGAGYENAIRENGDRLTYWAGDLAAAPYLFYTHGNPTGIANIDAASTFTNVKSI